MRGGKIVCIFICSKSSKQSGKKTEKQENEKPLTENRIIIKARKVFHLSHEKNERWVDCVHIQLESAAQNRQNKAVKKPRNRKTKNR